MSSQEAIKWTPRLLVAGVGLSAFTSGLITSFSTVSVPVILTNPTNALVLQAWKQTLALGVRIAPPLAISASLVHAANAYLNRASDRMGFFVAAALGSVGIVPFTILVLGGTNRELFRREMEARGKGDVSGSVEGETVALVRRWARLNLLRAGLPALGALCAFLAL